MGLPQRDYMSRFASHLAEFLRITPETCQSLGLQDTLVAACEYAAKRFHTKHSALLLFSPDRSHGIVLAEYPENYGTVGTSIPVTGVRAEENLISTKKP